MADFRAETIYFIVVDRFADGNPANNHGKDSDNDPTRTDWWKWWGGDLRGVLEHVDYLQSLGVTAVWLTPLFEQIEGTALIDGKQMAPYHGYWARDFKRIDPHLVDRVEDVRLFARKDTVFDQLIAELHRRGMKVVLDIVCNHSNPSSAGGRGVLQDDGEPIATYNKDTGGWYRKTGGVTDWNDLADIQDSELAGLADFNEETWAFRNYIKTAMRDWLDKGVDAFRVDTVKHMPLWFWQEFSGDMVVHRPDLFMFGEWFQGGCWDADSVTFARRSGMSMIDFAWRNAIVNTLAHRSTRGFQELAEVIDKDVLYRDPSELVTFVDNHDLPRFLSLSDDKKRFRLAVLLTLVSRGIPCLYYGGEQFLHVDINRGNDPYNRPWMSSFDHNEFCDEIARLSALRRRNTAIQKGGMRKKWLDADIYAFTRSWLGSHILVAVNRGDKPVDIGLVGLELPDGEYDDVLGGEKTEVLEGAARVTVPGRGMVVFAVQSDGPKGKVLVDVQVHGVRTEFGQEIVVCGDAPELGQWDVDRAVRLEYVNHATWAGTVAFDESLGREIHYKYVIRSAAGHDREPGRGHHRRVPTHKPALIGAPEGSVSAIWRDHWRE